MGTKSRESIYGSSVRHSAERAAEARKEADRLACVAWNQRMLGYKGPAQPSPTLGDALNAGYRYLEVRCLGCDTGRVQRHEISHKGDQYTFIGMSASAKANLPHRQARQRNYGPTRVWVLAIIRQCPNLPAPGQRNGPGGGARNRDRLPWTAVQGLGPPSDKIRAKPSFVSVS
jgi:hypothetical protein